MRNSASDRMASDGQIVCVSQFVPGLRENFLAPAVDAVCVDYEGLLGDQKIAELVLLTAKGEYVTFDVPQDAQQEFRALCVALLETRFPDWSAADGAEGQFLWDLQSDSLTHTHHLKVLPHEIAEGVAPISGQQEGLHDRDIPF
jgi:hypothetical protein